MKSINGSTFYAYATAADNFEHIKKVYTAIKGEHLSASHVMCGYRIFGAKFFSLQDYSNDGEYSGGKVILDQIKAAKIWNMAVFVVRYHEGPNLGKLRLQIIADLAKDVIGSFPAALNYGSGFRDQELIGAFEKMESDRKKRESIRCQNVMQKTLQKTDYNPSEEQ